MSPLRSNKSETLWLAAATALMLAAFAYLSHFTHWTDSELWSITSARRFGAESGDAVGRYKILFEGILSWIYRLDHGDIGTVDAARVLFALNGFIIAALTGLVAYRIYGKAKETAWAVFLLATTSFFISQGFRVRSDLLACTFQLAGLFGYLQMRDSGVRRNKIWAGLTAVSHAAVLLATPKGLYHIFVNLSYIYNDRRKKKIDAWTRKYAVAAFLSALVLILAFIWIYRVEFGFAWSFFVSSFGKDVSRPDYVSLAAFEYLLRFPNENLVLFTAFLAVAAVGLRARNVSPVLLAALTASAFMILHNDRLPFFILSLMPMICIAVAGPLAEVRIQVRIFLAVAIFLVALKYANRVKKLDGNFEQRQAMAQMIDYIEARPGTTYFDATGVLPRLTQLFYNVEVTGSPSWKMLSSVLQKSKPEVIFMGNRLFYHIKNFMEYVDTSGYISLGGGVFVRAVRGTSSNKACAEFKGQSVFYYVGPSFSRVSLVKEWPPSGEAYCSKFPPVKFAGGKSFSEIFDHDADF